ncbi:hypothetical protein [Xanthomonas oryzae]|uniref:hypothetical protein n=1 Tax=Xanthomonas oryzae TaxID=347 RepID=UPI0010336CAB|nr:hypothetical protein [Xanthomonas oryzae]QBG99186.1 hypothetical protein EYC56_07095 [Xanthomonas oryzae]
MRIKYLLAPYLTLTLTSCFSSASFSAETITVVPRKIDPSSFEKGTISLIEIDPNESIDLKKTITWEILGDQYYFFPVQYGSNQGCRFVFVNATQKKAVSDGDFNFENCSFIKAPEIVDLNHDGINDIRVWLNLPNQTNPAVNVNHNIDFIYTPEKKMFCEPVSGIPCNSVPE